MDILIVSSHHDSYNLLILILGHLHYFRCALTTRPKVSHEIIIIALLARHILLVRLLREHSVVRPLLLLLLP